MTNENQLKKGQKLAAKALFLESGLATAKVVIGFFSGSTVLISDAFHSLADLSSIFTSWFSLKIAQKKADERFPYGYYKAENLGTLIISGLIFYAAWQMFQHGYQRFFSFSIVKLPLLALAISFADALILFFFGKYEIKIGKQVNVQSLVTMGRENKTHLFSSLAVFAGILAAIYRVPYFEGVITMIIALLILKIGLTAAKDSIFALMDVSPGEAVEKKVARTIESVPGVEEFFDLRLRQAGPFVFGETKVGIRKSVDVQRSHEIADKVETAIKKGVSQITSFTVHVEPFHSDYRHLAIPIKKKQGLNSLVADRFARAPYFLFINFKRKQVKGYFFLANPFQKQKIKAGLAAAKLIAKQKSDLVIASKIGEIARYSLRENLVDLVETRHKTVQKVINEFAQKI